MSKSVGYRMKRERRLWRETLLFFAKPHQTAGTVFIPFLNFGNRDATSSVERRPHSLLRARVAKNPQAKWAGVSIKFGWGARPAAHQHHLPASRSSTREYPENFPLGPARYTPNHAIFNFLFDILHVCDIYTDVGDITRKLPAGEN